MGPTAADRSSGRTVEARAGILDIMKCLARLWVIVYLTGALAACGQKGPLVLPDAAPKHKHTVPTLPGAAKPPAPANTGPATTPVPPAGQAPQPAPTPPQP